MPNPRRQLPVRVVWWLAVLFSLGVWVGLVLGVKTLADVSWGLASRINREVNSADHGPDDNCVDFSNAKLAALIAAGADPADLELRVVRVRIPGTRVRRFHQVLIVNVPGDRIVLDNMTRKVWPLATFERQLAR